MKIQICTWSLFAAITLLITLHCRGFTFSSPKVFLRKLLCSNVGGRIFRAKNSAEMSSPIILSPYFWTFRNVLCSNAWGCIFKSRNLAKLSLALISMLLLASSNESPIPFYTWCPMDLGWHWSSIFFGLENLLWWTLVALIICITIWMPMIFFKNTGWILFQF